MDKNLKNILIVFVLIVLFYYFFSPYENCTRRMEYVTKDARYNIQGACSEFTKW